MPFHLHAYQQPIQSKTEYSEPQDTTITPGFHGNYVVADIEQVAIATENWEKAISLAKKRPVTTKLPYDPCSCVSYAKWLSGINVGSMSSFGAGYGAKNHPVNSPTPVVGGIAVFKSGVGMSFNGHLAVVIEVDGNKITTRGANEISCVAGTIRHYDLGVDYWKFKGFYNP